MQNISEGVTTTVYCQQCLQTRPEYPLPSQIFVAWPKWEFWAPNNKAAVPSPFFYQIWQKMTTLHEAENKGMLPILAVLLKSLSDL